MSTVCGYRKYKSNARGLEIHSVYSTKITEVVLKRLFVLEEMSLMQVAILIKCLTTWLATRAYLGMHLSVYPKSEIGCPPRYLVKHKNLQL
jgi:hypothetical protein